MKIILVGYMGSGKSVVAAKLSALLQIPFVELDQLIENRTASTITKIFSEKGELFFRKLEQQIFAEQVALEGILIISTGGGTLCYYNNHEILNYKDVKSFYLSATLQTLVNRLQFEKEKRPLITHLTDSQTHEFISKHLFERSYFYHKAQVTVRVDHKSVVEIATEILNYLT